MSLPQPIRKPSGGRPPPVFAPGLPVAKGKQLAQTSLPPQPQGFTQPSHRHPSSSQRMSNPPPSTSLHPSRQAAHANPNGGRKMSQPHLKPMPFPSPSVSPRTNPLPRPPSSSTTSTLSSRASPNMSESSNGSLRESTRHNARPPMPPHRQSTADSGWDERLKTPKEDWVDVGRGVQGMVAGRGGAGARGGQVKVVDELEAQFDHLLDSLQVPASVRQKFTTVSSDVKTSILYSNTANPSILSSLGLPLPPSSPQVKKRMSTPLLRKAKSSGSLGGGSPEVGRTYNVAGEPFTIVASPLSSPDPQQAAPPSNRGRSVDLPRSAHHAASMRMSTGPPTRPISALLFSPSSSSSSIPSFGKSSGKGLGIAMHGEKERPEAFVSWLKAHKGTDLNMDVARAKKLRMLLRHESTGWVQGFCDMGGYELVLDRLQDLLDVEWREEQHDDQMLHELLRIVKALSTSEIGKSQLRRLFPRPFPALSALLFSEKKPGDLPIRQLIVELWLFLFDLFPFSGPPRERPSSVRFESGHAPPLAMREDATRTKVDLCETVRGLLVPDLPDKTKEMHEFITQSHRPRVFRAWVGELSDICRDYFWITCHAENHLWDLDEVDPALVERPVAPGGATGGVEFEAMNYVMTHFKLLNALCASLAKQDLASARAMHNDLLMSGMDRILVTFRKASVAYYPTLHLELARYVHLLRMASPNARLPYLIDRMVGHPPEEVRRRGLAPQGQGYLPPVNVGGAGRRGGWDPQL